MENDKKIVITVKAARVNAKKTQKEAADALGLSLNAYKRKENGIRRFYIDEIVVLSRFFGVSLDCFYESQCHKKTRDQEERMI